MGSAERRQNASFSYFNLQAPFKKILFVLYAVQLTQVLIISDFLPLPLLVCFHFLSEEIHPSLQVLNTAAWHMKG